HATWTSGPDGIERGPGGGEPASGVMRWQVEKNSAALALWQYIPDLGMHAADRLDGGVPVDAGVGDGHAVLQLRQSLVDCLVAPADMAFHHEADDRVVAIHDLVGHVVHHQRLQGWVLVGVGVAAVDHDVRLDAGLFQLALAQGNADRIVVGLAVAAAQHHVAIAVAAGGDQRNLAFMVDAHEAMRAGGGLQGIDGHAEVAVGAVLEADRAGQARGQFTVGLGFGGARADGGPGNQVLQVLRRDRVQGLGGGGQAQLDQVAEQLTADVQSVLDLETVIQIRVVDQSFPANGGTRLLEVHAHDQIQGVADLGGQLPEPTGIVLGRLDIMNGAGADDDEQAVVLAVENVANDLAASAYGGLRRLAHGDSGLELGRCNHRFVGSNVQIINR